ncbi:MAG: hypothetical protein WA633_28125, partial [Stellaceae bacterium]
WNGATAGYTGSRGAGEVRPRGKPCCHLLQRVDFTPSSNFGTTLGEQRRVQWAATVEALQRAVANPWARICAAPRSSNELCCFSHRR